MSESRCNLVARFQEVSDFLIAVFRATFRSVVFSTRQNMGGASTLNEVASDPFCQWELVSFARFVNLETYLYEGQLIKQ